MTGAPWDEIPTPLHDVEPDPLPGWSAPDPEPAPAPAGPGTDLAPVLPADLLRLDDPLALSAVLRDLRAGLTARVGDLMTEARAGRGSSAKPSAADLLVELRAASAAHDALNGVAGVLTDIRKLVDDHAAEAMQEVLGEKRKTAKVQDAHGGEITVALESRTETSVDEAVVLDITGSHRVAAYILENPDDPAAAMTYAEGVRDGISALRDLLGATLPWKTTALTALGKDLQAGGTAGAALAGRLDGAWTKVSKGDPVASIKVKPAPATEPPAAPAATPMPSGEEA